MISSNDHLRIDAQVIRQLGDQLITDAEQALLELIKNSYDADATSVSITIDTEFMPSDGEIPSGAIGGILVNDTGLGLSEENIKNGWLVISLSPKRRMKQQGLTTWRKRTPLGDKGLGRLGTMKLGRYLELSTANAETPEQLPHSAHRVFIDWGKFTPGVTLDQVPITVEQTEIPKKPFTSVAVYGLSDTTYWKGAERRDLLQKNLSTLISPFLGFQDFKIKLNINGTALDLDRIGPQIRNSATTTFSVSWNGISLSFAGKARIDLLKASTENDQSTFFNDAILADRGQRFLDFLMSRGGAKQFSIKPSAQPWYIEFSQDLEVTQLQIPELADEQGNPGRFHGEIDSFALDGASAADGIFSNYKEYKEYVKRQSGIYVYRDNFGVRMPKDWAGLGLSWTSGRSYYGLKPSTTIGYIAITAAGNPQLSEKSDREGFLDAPASRCFVRLAQSFVKQANDVLTFIRRSYVEYRSIESSKAINQAPNWTPGELTKVLQDLDKDARIRGEIITNKTEQVVKKLGSVEEGVKSLRGLFTREPVDRTLSELASLQTEIRALRQTVNSIRDSQQEPIKIANVSLERIALMSRQLEDVYETVGVGIAAQALAHDVHAILDDIVGRTMRLRNLIRINGSERDTGLDKEASIYVEYILVAINNLRKQIAFIEPMMRGTREVKQEFRVSDFLTDYIALRRDRLHALGIAVELKIRKDFSVYFNRGRLLQIVDNLFRNSEYWLRQQQIHYPSENSIIRVEINAPTIVVSDTGPGVRAALEETLFDLFVSDKPKKDGQGHGLGLFIVTQLLERDNCHIWLDSERNQRGNRFKFMLDLASAQR